jgi:uncharacterized protein YkwD
VRGGTGPTDQDGAYEHRPRPGRPSPPAAPTHTPTPPGSRGSRPGPGPQADSRVSGRRGWNGARHRSPRLRPGRLRLAATVALLLATFGIGATLLPASFADVPDSVATTGTPTPNRTGAGPTPPATASARAAAGPTAAASPSPSPTPRRPASRTGTATSGDPRTAQVVAIVNRERAVKGCGAVKINDRLATAARLHSADQAAHDTMSHTGSDGSSFQERAERAGYSDAIGENVAYGYRTAEAVMDGWMNSSGHRANILNCAAKAIGVGVAAAGNGTLYWTQVFGSTG